MHGDGEYPLTISISTAMISICFLESFMEVFSTMICRTIRCASLIIMVLSLLTFVSAPPGAWGQDSPLDKARAIKMKRMKAKAKPPAASYETSPAVAAPATSRIVGPFQVGKGPMSLAIDSSGNAWVANSGDNTLTELSPLGAVLGTFPSPYPTSVAISPSGNIWAPNNGYPGLLTEFSSTGSVLKTVPVPHAPEVVVIDSSGTIWVGSNEMESAKWFGYVSKLDASGNVLGTFAVGRTFGGMAVDPSGNVWVVNYNESSVTKLDSSGNVVGTFRVGESPHGIAIDHSGNVWVTNSLSRNVTELSSSGALVGTFSAGNDPMCIAIDSSGNVWVGNWDDNTVTQLSSSGAILGTFPVGKTPRALAVDPSGNVWVLNGSDNTVSKILRNTTTATTAGSQTPQNAATSQASLSGFYDPERTSDFDVLDGVRVNPKHGTIILFGHHDGSGAVRSVPYLDYLATALESSNPTFSLEWTPESRQSIDRAFNMADQELTARLGDVVQDGQLTKRGAWWFKMLGANVYEGMDKMSLWMAVMPAAGYPDAAKVMRAVDSMERAVAAGTGDQKVQYDDIPVPETPMMHLASVASALAAPMNEGNNLQTFADAANGDEEAKKTLFTWILRGIAIAYKEDENRYTNRAEELEREGTEWETAVAKALELSQDDTVDVQKNAFYALVGSRAFIHVPPDIMRDVLGVDPVVVPVFQGLSENSLLSKVAFDADVFGKNLMDSPEIKSDIPGYRTYFEWRQTVDRAPATEGHTWFAPDGFELVESGDGRTVRFGKTPIRIHMEKYDTATSLRLEARRPYAALRVDGAFVAERESIEDPLLRQYADELTSLYEPLAAKYPVLLDLRESMKVMAIADWLKRKGIKLNLPAEGRGVWNPPATYPGVIHMEIATKEGPVGEVMSASGGIDFRVDGNWDLIKEAIEAQPGPPPAHGVIIGYNPDSGAVTHINPLTNSAWSPTPQVGSVSRSSQVHSSSLKRNPNAHIKSVSSPHSSASPVQTSGNTPRLLREADSSGGSPVGVSPQANLPTCAQTLANLEKEVSNIQVALTGLNKSMEHNPEVREESEKAINKAVDEGKDKLLSAFIDLTGNVLDDRLEEATQESQLAVLKRMQDNISPDKRQQYDAAFKILSGQKKDIARVIDRFHKLEAANDLREIDSSLAEKDSSKLERFYDVGTKFLADPLVQKTFKYLQPAATPLKIGDAIRGDLDAGYLLGAEYLNWQNIKQLDVNTDKYLNGIKGLRTKLEATMKRIKTVQREMRQSKVSGCQ